MIKLNKKYLEDDNNGGAKVVRMHFVLTDDFARIRRCDHDPNEPCVYVHDCLIGFCPNRPCPHGTCHNRPCPDGPCHKRPCPKKLCTNMSCLI